MYHYRSSLFPIPSLPSLQILQKSNYKTRRLCPRQNTQPSQQKGTSRSNRTKRSRQNVRTGWTTKPPKHHQNRRQTAKESQHGGLYSRHTNPTGHTINLSGHQRAPNPVLTFQNQGGNLISVVNWLFALANCVLLLQIWTCIFSML